MPWIRIGLLSNESYKVFIREYDDEKMGIDSPFDLNHIDFSEVKKDAIVCLHH